MEFLNYSLLSLLSFLGIVVGIILVKIAPEEQKPGKTYLIAMQNILIILSVVFFVIYIINNLYLLNNWIYNGIIILAALFLAVYIIKIKDKDNFIKSGIAYLFFGFIFFLSLNNSNLLLIQAVIILLFGMPTGSILFDIKKKNQVKVLLNHILFLIIPLVLYLLDYHLSFLILR